MNSATLQEKGDCRQAYELLRHALRIFKADGSGDHPRLAGLYNNLALIEKLQGRFAMAGDHYRKALAHAVAGFGENHPETAKITGNLAALLSDSGEFQEAERCFRQALAIYKGDPAERFGPHQSWSTSRPPGAMGPG